MADITVMVAPGASPATYEPKPSQMKKVTKAQIYFAIGVPFEKAWLPRFKTQNPKMQIIDTTRGIKKLPMASHHHHKHPQHSTLNTQHSLDPHVWLSPPLVKIQARNIAEALGNIDPAHKAVYKKNLEKFELEIDELDLKLREILKPCHGNAMMVFHPSWGYFAHAYGLKQIPIEIEGKEPKSRELVHLIREAKEEGVKALFVQPQFSKRTARVIAESIGAKIVMADPLAPDWSDNLLRIAKKVCEVAR
ncbi:metal ABC transporter solute-binding protein, Zn/Mn family [Hydrogenimonas cancrithermarum]|uniref:metal ABC transporter solute-binding protein, Zn/Mn family n=1 Tax=Hydrogenimonas cancrithermarum TaxID=2993563 RepID=UPI0025732FCB|nr:zinc ABC transporter substrate-binding protein [Hydrogenimonas cancrithermarum]